MIGAICCKFTLSIPLILVFSACEMNKTYGYRKFLKPHIQIMTNFLHSKKLAMLTAIFAIMCVRDLTSALQPIASNAKLRDHAFPSVAFDGANYLVGLQLPNSGDTVSQVAVQLVSATGALAGLPILIATEGRATIVAFDGANYLVSWNDNTLVYGQLVSKAGAKVGPVFEIGRIALTGGNSGVRTLSFDGTNYLVLWREGNNDLYVRRVSTTGAALGSALKVNTGSGGPAEVAFDGANYLVIWTDESAQGMLGRFVTPAGGFGSDVFIIDAGDVSGRRILFAGTKYVVAFHEAGAGAENVFARFVSTAGVVSARITISATTRSERSPTMAFDGSNYLFLWTDRVTSTDIGLRGRFFTTSGTPTGAEFLLTGPQGTKLPRFAHLIFDGAQFFALAELQGVTSDLVAAFLPSTSTPPRLTVLGPIVAGQFRAILMGTPGMTYAVEAAADVSMASPGWSVVATDTITASSFSFLALDSNATGNQKFYRGVKR